MTRAGVAFYCVTGRDFFPGAAAMLNSLRLAGHGQPVFALDCGMTPAQRDSLRRHAVVVPAPTGSSAPSALKLLAPRAYPAEVMVILDADLIVLQSLDELIERAGAGALVAFQNDVPRYFAEWSAELDLPTVRPDPYLTSSLVAFGGRIASRTIEAIHSRQTEVAPERTWVGGGRPDDPLFYFDQDVLNAVAHSLLDPAQVVALDHELAPIPPFDGLRLADAATLSVKARDGTRPLVLHHASHKPWLVRMRSSIYTRLLTRLLFEPDVPVRLAPGDLPLRLRGGPVAAIERLRTDLALAAPGLVRRLRGRPAPVPAWPRAGER